MNSTSSGLDDLQTRLDLRNKEALDELNKQIDELGNIPLNSQLPPYDDTIDLIQGVIDMEENKSRNHSSSSPSFRDSSGSRTHQRQSKTTAPGLSHDSEKNVSSYGFALVKETNMEGDVRAVQSSASRYAQLLDKMNPREVPDPLTETQFTFPTSETIQASIQAKKKDTTSTHLSDLGDSFSDFDHRPVDMSELSIQLKRDLAEFKQLAETASARSNAQNNQTRYDQNHRQEQVSSRHQQQENPSLLSETIANFKDEPSFLDFASSSSSLFVPDNQQQMRSSLVRPTHSQQQQGQGAPRPVKVDVPYLDRQESVGLLNSINLSLSGIDTSNMSQLPLQSSPAHVTPKEETPFLEPQTFLDFDDIKELEDTTFGMNIGAHNFTQDTEALFARAEALSDDGDNDHDDKHAIRESLTPKRPKSQAMEPSPRPIPIPEFDDHNYATKRPHVPSSGSSEALASMARGTLPKLPSVTSIPDLEPNRPLGHLPTDQNSLAVVNALRTLQERVGKLEGEKRAAREKIQDLEKELSTTRKLLYHSQVSQPPIQPPQILPGTTTDPNVVSEGANPLPEFVNSGSFPPNPTRQANRKDGFSSIEEARQKVAELKQRVDRVRDLSRERPKQDVTSSVPVLLEESAPQTRLDLASGLPPSKPPSPIKQAWMGQPGHVPSNIDSTPLVSRSEDPQHIYSSSHRANMPQAEHSFLTDNEISRLQREIEAERIVHEAQRAIDLDKETIKSRLVEKLASESMFSKKKKSKSSKTSDMNTISISNRQVPPTTIPSVRPFDPASVSVSATDPTWKKLNSRPIKDIHGKSVRVSKRESSHVRKRPPIEMPFVVEQADTDRAGREMPFIVGKNTGKSFSVTANLQRVFSLLKAHNPALCTICSKRKSAALSSSSVQRGRSHSRSRPVHVLDPDHRHQKVHGSSNAKSNSSKSSRSKSVASQARTPKPDEGFQELDRHDGTELGIQLSETQSLKQALAVLEQEFQDLKVQYHGLVAEYEKVAESITCKAISEAAGSKTLKFIGDELKLVIQNMETKGDQIAILREIIQSSILHEQRHDKKKEPIVKPTKLKRYQLHTTSSLSRTKETSSSGSLNLKSTKSVTRINSQTKLDMKPSMSTTSGTGPNQAIPTVSDGSDHRGRSEQRTTPQWRGKSSSPSRLLASLSLLKSSLKVQNALSTEH